MADVLELKVPVKLESPNWLRNPHWSARGLETKRWQAAIHWTAGGRLQDWSLIVDKKAVLDKRGLFKFVEVRKKERRRVAVLRLVANGLQFIKDDDNLKFAMKPVNDALKRIGLLYQDNRVWLEQPPIDQAISPDGHPYTILRIERVGND